MNTKKALRQIRKNGYDKYGVEEYQKALDEEIDTITENCPETGCKGCLSETTCRLEKLNEEWNDLYEIDDTHPFILKEMDTLD